MTITRQSNLNRRGHREHGTGKAPEAIRRRVGRYGQPGDYLLGKGGDSEAKNRNESPDAPQGEERSKGELYRIGISCHGNGH